MKSVTVSYTVTYAFDSLSHLFAQHVHRTADGVDIDERVHVISADTEQRDLLALDDLGASLLPLL